MYIPKKNASLELKEIFQVWSRIEKVYLFNHGNHMHIKCNLPYYLYCGFCPISESMLNFLLMKTEFSYAVV